MFLLIFLVSSFMAFLAQKLIYTINTWFNFMVGSFFGQDHLINLFILGVYGKRWPKCARISIQKLMSPKIWSITFFLNLTVRGTFHRKDFKLKKKRNTGLISEKKRKHCMLNLTKERKQPPVVKAVLHGTICMIRIVWLLFDFSTIGLIWTCKLQNRNNFLH